MEGRKRGAASSADAEAAVRSLPEGYPEEEAGQDPQSNLPTVKVSKSDMPDPDPLHAGPEAVGAPADVFDPNAALRNKLNRGPGLQDSEAKNPAVWTDVDEEKSRNAAADSIEQEAERAMERAKARADAIRKGEPAPDNA